jgi:hypothetical protein
MNTIWALAGIVIKELYRRKDFYVLFVLTALITVAAGMVNFFDDPKIVRYVKDICMLLIWISALIIALVTTARQIPAEPFFHGWPSRSRADNSFWGNFSAAGWPPAWPWPFSTFSLPSSPARVNNTGRG